MRNVRPSWVQVSVSHNGEALAPASVGKGGTGPRSRKGDLAVEVLVRERGAARKALTVEAFAIDDGKAVDLIVSDASGKVVFRQRVEQ